MSQIVDKIRSKGYWDLSIRPEPFVADRVPYENLDTLLQKAAVRLRGWPVPAIHPGEYQRGEHWIAADVDAEVVDHYEAWRFFQSGQFNQLRIVGADWERSEQRTRVPEGYEAVIEVWEILYYLTEVIELAARLSLTEAGADRMTVSVTLVGLENRALVMGYPHYQVAGFMAPHKTDAAELSSSETLKRDQLVGETRSLAVAWARSFFLRFGWKPEPHLLSQLQQKLDAYA